jgi:hypothetical protein
MKAAKKPKDVKGRNNQLSTQDIIINQYRLVENNCRHGSESICRKSSSINSGASEKSNTEPLYQPASVGRRDEQKYPVYYWGHRSSLICWDR